MWFPEHAESHGKYTRYLPAEYTLVVLQKSELN